MSNPTFHRTNLNLYTEDVEYMQHIFGRGWTEQARDIIHQEIKAIKERTRPYTPNENTVTVPFAAWRKINLGTSNGK